MDTQNTDMLFVDVDRPALLGVWAFSEIPRPAAEPAISIPQNVT